MHYRDLELYPCQAAAVDDAVRFLLSAGPGERRGYRGPTGVGKSVIELAAQELLGGAPGTVIVTPRTEIAAGMARKAGAGDPESIGVWTPVRLMNELRAGRVAPPARVILDETHHSEADSWRDLLLVLGFPPHVGFTASFFRGTPRGTAAFREYWGEPVTICTWPEAVALGYVSMPEFEVLPLVDDDVVEVVNGEFRVTSLEGATVDRLSDLVARAAPWCRDGRWDLATVFCAPSRAVAGRLARELSAAGAPAVTVTADTTDRERLFRATEERLCALVHVDVVSEGVDLRLRRYVDLSPTLSPVKWLQRFGRVTRPWAEGRPRYVCTNRNVARHAYVLEDALPSSVVARCEAPFPAATRPHVRVLGMEAIGRFRPAHCRMVGGGRLTVYSLFAVVGSTVVDWACLVPPTGEPVWACRAAGTDRAETGEWGQWRRPDAPPTDLTGFQSRAPTALSEKQSAWWHRAAARHGLDGTVEPDAKAFQALPVLKDLGARVH